MPELSPVLFAWLVFANAVTFLLFGWDKWRAVRGGWRVPELQLVLWGVVGGWLGGILGMFVFRHKISKSSFRLKYGFGLLILAGLVWADWKWSLV
jgi:uncharacterized membrane protein YsdA (DUF1294 family)